MTQDNFKVDGEFSLITLAQKSMSFVSNSSTSGFVVPSSSIIAHYQNKPGFEDLVAEDLMEGGPLFSQVLFGNSHQGSAVNLLSNSSDVAAFCDTCVDNYVEIAEGEANTVGAVYKVKDDAAEPFNTVTGKEFTLMSVTPVLNAPFVANLEALGQEDFDKFKNYLLQMKSQTMKRSLFLKIQVRQVYSSRQLMKDLSKLKMLGLIQFVNFLSKKVMFEKLECAYVIRACSIL